MSSRVSSTLAGSRGAIEKRGRGRHIEGMLDESAFVAGAVGISTD